MSISIYKTPGVYVKEISTLPPSVAEVATAVPAFIGYTKIGPANGAKTEIKRIASMLEFETAFGGPKPSRFTVHVPIDASGNPTGNSVVTQPTPGEGFALYYALTHYFKNGGGPCYIVSVGSYANTATAKESFSTGLKALERMDEPTLIVLTDAACLLNESKYYELCAEALEQCNKLGNRFTIIDVPIGATQDAFRTGLKPDYLMYGAAYYPYLQTSICCDYEDSKVVVRSRVRGNLTPGQIPGLKVTYSGPAISTPTVALTVIESNASTFKVEGRLLNIRAAKDATAKIVSAAWKAWDGKPAGFDISAASDSSGTIAAPVKPEILMTEVTGVRGSLELGGDLGLKVTFTGGAASLPAVKVVESSNETTFKVTGDLLTISAAKRATAATVLVAWEKCTDKGTFGISATGNGNGAITARDEVKLALTVTVSRDLGNGLKVTFSGPADSSPAVKVELSGTGQSTFTVNGNLLAIHAATNTNAAQVADAWKAWDGRPAGFDISTPAPSAPSAPPAPTDGVSAVVGTASWIGIAVDHIDETLESQKSSATAVYNRVRAALAEQYIVLPPSAAMAGIYARVDRDQGVWKSPANVSVMAVLGATTKITDQEQENLNIDPTAGKSINAIRDFTGKGTLVWGGRTLAGNSNEWRYVSVRRLFITIEESCKKASAFAVFEPNDQTTWLKVKAMIESYLYGLWEQGALAGSKPEAAYHVHVGLDTTMILQDVLEGRMLVEVGVAAVRPAEFIVLKFSHKMQTA